MYCLFQVGWIHLKRQMIVAVHTRMITRIDRFSVTHDDHKTWTLHIHGVQEEDRGYYMCQVNTEPYISEVGYLQVVGESNISIMVYIQVVSRSNISNVCYLKVISEFNISELIYIQVVGEPTISKVGHLGVYYV